MTTAADCQCAMPTEMTAAGEALQLCHHSNVEGARRIHTTICDIIDDLTHTIPAQDMFSKSVQDLAYQYMRTVIGHDINLMNEREHDILMVSFLRYMALGFQATMSALVVSIREQENQDNPRRP